MVLCGQISEAATTTAKVSDLEGMERHLIKLSNQLRQKDTVRVSVSLVSRLIR